MAVSYGTGTATAFTDASARQVLELGKKIHYYNPSVTPILTVGGRASTRNTPVPIFEWMEDEYMMKKSVKVAMVDAGADSATTTLSDTATSGVNGENAIINFPRQAQVEAFEVGGIYSASFSGTATAAADITHFICIAIGEDCNLTSPGPNSVQFVGAHVHTSLNAYNTEAIAGGTDMIGFNADTTLTLTYIGTAGAFYDNAVATSYYGYNIHSGSNGFGEINFADADYFMVEGGAGQYAKETRKKVRRLKNCTQIFREPYSITGTAKASKHYGGSELSRLQARKLNKIKTDVEWAILTNGDIALDATAENPKRTFAGLGLGGSAGVIKSCDGRSDSDYQWNTDGGSSNGVDDLDRVIANVFQDMVGGSMNKTVFCSNKWLRELVGAVRASSGATLNASMGKDVKGGLRVTKYMGPVGECDFVAHPMLNGVHEDFAVAIDFSNFDWRPLAGRNLKLRKDVVKDGMDGQMDEWLIEAGAEIRNEQTHAILKIV